MQDILQAISSSPLAAFTILLLVVLIIPPIFERLRLPGLVGLLVAGVVLGPSGVGVLDGDTETMKLLSDIGKIYLMFVAGLEIDLGDFRKNKNRSLSFGLATFAVPLIAGTFIGYQFGYGWNAAILIGSLLASHTLLGYPIVQRLGIVRSEVVSITIGATIFTDIAALLVLAICVSIHQGEFSPTSFILQITSLVLYAIVVLFGFDRAGKEYFRRTGDEQGNQFLFVLLAVFLAAVGAQIINIDKIVGAFLAGLAVNDVVGNGPVKEKVEFVGGVMFIPFFFIGMGLLLDIPLFIETLTQQYSFTLAIVFGLLASKFLAALLMKGVFGYGWYGTFTMWSLSMPQVAATLAAALAGVEANLIDSQVFNAVIVLMLITSLLGPLLTERFASRMPLPKHFFEEAPQGIWWETQAQESVKALEAGLIAPPRSFTVVVPVSNPLTTMYLIEMASLLARHEAGRIVPLVLSKAHVHMDEPALDHAIFQARRLLTRAVDIGKSFDVVVEPAIRIDDDVANGISRVAREQDASLIVMGWGESVGLRARLFGNVIDNVFWSSHCPVAVMRLLDEPMTMRRILVPVKNVTPQTIRTIQFALLFADVNQAEVTVLHVSDRRTLAESVTDFETSLSNVLSTGSFQNSFKIRPAISSLISEDVAGTIIKASTGYDLVILRSIRRRTAGGLAVSDVTTEVVNQLTCSLVLFGEPHS
ncbi:cation:proton antiporter [Leptolyngbya sp. CCY15150]|uniref:cation:proton antiporter domain-containing protein n=1 Tax=Leptolyngbya sp. CCY15150 TaxID=2767772 RepID=UPI00194F1AD3|nr:cation:proton antiporter [Leptolyngbya sp. CCY15150]